MLNNGNNVRGKRMTKTGAAAKRSFMEATSDCSLAGDMNADVGAGQ